MKWAIVALVLAGLAMLGVAGFESGAEREIQAAAQLRFEAVDVFLDSGAALLGAYQIELFAGAATLVGIEGGAGAFAQPPYYDPEALSGGRVILAAFSTDNKLPTGESHVARVHVRVVGDAHVKYQIKVMTAGSPDGALQGVRARSAIKGVEQ